MTDNLSVNVNLNSHSQSGYLIENASPDSLPSSSEMSTEEKLLSMETPMSRLLANSGGGLENEETPKMTSLGLPPGSVLTATPASSTVNTWSEGYQGSSSDNKLIDLAKIPIRVVGTAITLGTFSIGLGGYEPVEFKERGDLRVQHDGDTGSTIIERLDPVDGKWKPEEGVAYRDFASETGGEAKFVVNDEILTASTGGRPIHEPGKDDYVDITPYPNLEDHDTTTPPYPMAEQDKDSHIQSNPLPGEKLPWRTETPADRVDEPTVMLNEEQDGGSIHGTNIESSHVSGPEGSKMQVGDVSPNKRWTDKSVFNTYPEQTILNTSGIAEQSSFLSKHVPGLTTEQATLIIEQGLKRDSTVVFGGSRIRGDFDKGSDIDVGFGSLSEKQAQKIIKNVNKAAADNSNFLKVEELTIVPGKSTKTIETMTTPEQFFQRSGTRAGSDLKAGQPYIPSGSITITTDGKIIILPPGN